MSTRRGLQSWGDVATNTGPIHVGYRGDCCSPQDRTTPRRGQSSKPRGPVYSCEARATSPGFREVRYLDRDLTRRRAGTAMDTPGPGQYDIRVPLRRGTTFAGPRPKCSKTVMVGAFVASATKTTAAAAAATSNEGAGGRERRGSGSGAGQGARPPPAAAAAPSQRLSTPLMGKESPGPAYNLPSDFDLKLANKKTFHPPRCGGAKTKKRQVPRDRGRGATVRRRGQGTSLSEARRELSDVVASSGGGAAAGTALLGVPVKTSFGRGFLLRIRADGMTFVRLPWGVLYTMEVLTRGSAASPPLEDPAVPNSKKGVDMDPPATVEVDRRVDEEGGHLDEGDTPQPTGEI